MNDFRLDGVSGDKPADLIQIHSVFDQDLLGKNGFCASIEDILLREYLVRLDFRRGRGGNTQGIEHHHNGCDATERLVLLSLKMDAEGFLRIEAAAFHRG